jgi:hypothetical protein
MIGKPVPTFPDHAPGATFSRLTHFIQTDVRGKGLRARGVGLADAPVGNEVAGSD